MGPIVLQRWFGASCLSALLLGSDLRNPRSAANLQVVLILKKRNKLSSGVSWQRANAEMFSRCFKRGFPKKAAKLPECTGQNGLYMFHWCCSTLIFYPEVSFNQSTSLVKAVFISLFHPARKVQKFGLGQNAATKEIRTVKIWM